ncbi:MAG: sugar ABC transporter permease [Lachnospiraceae bacterium]|nr:sugar ABC transporter permease [Lachnospiraceae bacterium]MBD5455604.1 sugar ABC transporter permease [Lachnospiraceae bacterium]
MTKKRYTKYGYFFCIPFIVFFLAFNIIPLLFSIVISFTNWNGIEMAFTGLENYKRVLGDTNFIKSIKNTFLILIFISTPFTMFFSLLLTYFLNFKIRKMSKFVQMVSLIPYFTSTVAVGAIFSFLFNKNVGIVNSILVNIGLIDSPSIDWLGTPFLARVIVVIINQWTYVGYTCIFFIAGLTGISDDILEAAKVDGAREGKIFISICLPMLKEVLYFVVLTSIIGAFQQLEQEYMMFNGGIFGSNYPVGGPDGACLTMGLNFYNTSFISLQYGYGASIGMTNAVIIGLVSILLIKFLKKDKS